MLLQYSLKKVYYKDVRRILDYDFSSGVQVPDGTAPGIDQIEVPPESITGDDPLNFVFNLNADHFELDTTITSSLILKGTTTPTPGCTSPAGSSSGALEYTEVEMII